MNSNDLRKSFLDFFNSKNHKIVPSAPMVVKNDPTLMFTNAGMNQFKDIFLGTSPAKHSRIANSQKCLRVSGKHNDLEEVGHDTYHHTMFEMLGNWSFNDYFKKEAIAYAWEYLVDVLKINPDLLYATVFEGSKNERLEKDSEAEDCWLKYLPADRIILGSKKDNFWEMGETGPCGPCSEIHIDLRSEQEKKEVHGSKLVNTGDPRVIEIWNIVFIQYNRKADNSLETLPEKHIDTGMGFERLSRIVQKKSSNYDTDVFQPVIKKLEAISGIVYGKNEKPDIAMRVIADHIRAVSFAIADGQVPSNNKAGYVIRRILRRAIRYDYTYLDQKNPCIFKLVATLCDSMGEAYPELLQQKELIEKVIKEEELIFLKTLETGIKLLDNLIEKVKQEKKQAISGTDAFVLYDTYGFPIDLTQLILREHALSVNMDEFNNEMNVQKSRSRQAAATEAGDWIIINDVPQKFVGYDTLKTESKITRHRKISMKGKEYFQLTLDQTPFYGESGGQTGDTGTLTCGATVIPVIDTKVENNQTIHITTKLPDDFSKPYIAEVNNTNRTATANNHSATHLLHFALRSVLGNHVEQKGSLVHHDYFRFDFSHYQKISPEELLKIETIVNDLIRKNSPLEEFRNTPIKKAQEMGAMALFGEKYGEEVRVIRFGASTELCGGTHVKSTGQIGHLKITSESSIAAGIRRIEAVTAQKADEYINAAFNTLESIKTTLNNPADITKSIQQLIEQNSMLNSKIEDYLKLETKQVKETLLQQIEKIKHVNYIAQKINAGSAQVLKDISFQLKGELENLVLVLGAEIDGKAQLSVMISDNLVKDAKLNANTIIKDISTNIIGGGGGQPFFATSGGKNPSGIQSALQKTRVIVEALL